MSILQRRARRGASARNLIAARVNSAEITDAVLQIISRLFKKNWDQILIFSFVQYFFIINGKQLTFQTISCPNGILKTL